MPQGGTIRVQAENIVLGAESSLPLPAGNYIKITLTDQGHGIPADHLARIFDPYFTTKESGSGLGLAAAYAIVTKHGGTITVASTVGIGTTLAFYLPASEPPMASAPTALARPHLGKGKVLLVEDDEALRELARQMLTLLGYEVVSACDGSEALALYTNARAAGQPFTVVLLDLTMPGGMGSPETIVYLRALDPHVRAIVMSGYAQDPVLANFRQYGFHGALVKPYTLAALSDVVRRAILAT
jgi:CheY-like chemotaxis protein